MRSKGQRKIKCGALSRAQRVRPYLAAMRLDCCAGRSQAEAAATGALLTLWHAIEAIEDRVQMLRRDADALVGYAHAQLNIVGLQANRHGRSGLRIRHGVIEQVVERLLDA